MRAYEKVVEEIQKDSRFPAGFYDELVTARMAMRGKFEDELQAIMFAWYSNPSDRMAQALLSTVDAVGDEYWDNMAAEIIFNRCRRRSEYGFWCRVDDMIFCRTARDFINTPDPECVRKCCRKAEISDEA